MEKLVLWVDSIDLMRVRTLDGAFGAILTDLAHFGRISALKMVSKWHIFGPLGPKFLKLKLMRYHIL